MQNSQKQEEADEELEGDIFGGVDESECPICGSNDNVDTPDGRVECLICGAVFESE